MLIETERLILREMNPDDFDSLFRVLADSDIMKHYPYTFDEKRVRDWIDRNIDRYAEFGFGLWAVCLKETGEMIGDCGLTMQNIDGENLPEIGYHIRKDCQRKGFAKEAAAAVRDWAFENTRFERLYSYCTQGNEPSYKTAESIGMRFWKEYTNMTGEKEHVSAISRGEWLMLKYKLEFRKAKEDEKETILCLYRSVMNTQFCTWTDDYPSMDEINWDLSAGNLFVLTNSEAIVGAVSIVPENELNDLPFWQENTSVGEIARICLSPAFQGKGISAVLLEMIEDELIRRGIHAVHLLVAKKNIPAYRTYLKAGFSVRGECAMFGNDFYACEKVLE